MSSSTFPARQTRSRTRAENQPAASSSATEERTFSELQFPSSFLLDQPITFCPSLLTTTNTELAKDEIALLRFKQKKLRGTDISVEFSSRPHLRNAVKATLTFAQEECGTAVCIDSTGLLLTCAHCVAESREDLDLERKHWLLFQSGRAVQATCVLWEEKRDLALLRIVSAQDDTDSGTTTAARPAPKFPYMHIAPTAPLLRAKLLCIGAPGSEDLESTVPGAKTAYPVLTATSGHFQGLAKGQDVHDNSDIGALMHDCWTYWGHSGAPLVETIEGGLVGVHSSWDEETGMRRGVSWEAIRGLFSTAITV